MDRGEAQQTENDRGCAVLDERHIEFVGDSHEHKLDDREPLRLELYRENAGYALNEEPPANQQLLSAAKPTPSRSAPSSCRPQRPDHQQRLEEQPDAPREIRIQTERIGCRHELRDIAWENRDKK